MSFKLCGMDDRSIYETPVKSYTCTSVDDIDNLPKFGIAGTQVLCAHDSVDNSPCGYGSTAVVKGNGVWMLYPDNEWAKIS